MQPVFPALGSCSTLPLGPAAVSGLSCEVLENSLPSAPPASWKLIDDGRLHGPSQKAVTFLVSCRAASAGASGRLHLLGGMLELCLAALRKDTSKEVLGR